MSDRHFFLTDRQTGRQIKGIGSNIMSIMCLCANVTGRTKNTNKILQRSVCVCVYGRTRARGAHTIHTRMFWSADETRRRLFSSKNRRHFHQSPHRKREEREATKSSLPFSIPSTPSTISFIIRDLIPSISCHWLPTTWPTRARTPTPTWRSPSRSGGH